MTNPYIVPGARVRYAKGGLVDHVVTFISEDGATLRLAGYAERWKRRIEDFKPVVRVKMGRRVDPVTAYLHYQRPEWTI
jgi:hypothetical protein